jgi:UDPglucose--hexose-1-phosphate uridylyltransferase
MDFMIGSSDSSPHRRLNALTGDWVLVSPQRTKRPWQGRKEPAVFDQRSEFDPQCYLCPGNVRANGERNPNYAATYVFANDFAALLPDGNGSLNAAHPLLRADAVRGACRVICFSPRHDLTLARMAAEAIRAVIDTWAVEFTSLGQSYKWVQVFENKGEIMGCSNPHPHGQIWASDSLPTEIQKEDRRQRRYLEEQGIPLLVDYAQIELERRERLVIENEHWLAVVPFWAVWPFEVILLPKRQVLRLPDLAPTERFSLASILSRLLVRYDNLFEASFPYSMGWHGAPTDDGDYAYWQFHGHFYPPLLRSAAVKKFMVGYEMLAEPQRDLTPEQAAQRLREGSEIHYSRFVTKAHTDTTTA